MPTASVPEKESFAALFEESLARHDMRSGEVISAEVVRIDHNFVVVNAGLKSEAFIPIDEFKNDIGEIEVNVGDFVSVAIESLENGFGDTILSRDKAKRLASWLALEKAMESGEIVTGTVNGKVKGKVTLPMDCAKDEALAIAMADAKVQNAIAGKNVVKSIVVPNKIINLVVK